MVLPGHLAAAYVAAHCLKLDERVALAAALFPDVVDKLGRYVLQVTPSGRVPAHSLTLLLLTSMLIWVCSRRRRFVWAWGAGYLTHLAGDVVVDLIQGSGMPSFLLWPLLPAAESRYETVLGSVMDYGIAAIALEAGLTLIAAVVYLLHRRRVRMRRGQPGGLPEGRRGQSVSGAP